MSTSKSDDAYVLKWDLSHLGDDEFDAHLVKFPEWEDVGTLASPKPYSLPSRIMFEANFRTLGIIDYPYSDVRWPIMSKKMLDTLLAVGAFPHRVIPVIMIDDTVMTPDRYDDAGNPKPGVGTDRFVAVQLLEELDIFDWERSVYERHERFPEYITFVEKLVIKTPPGGFPPLFRIAPRPTRLFVSATARLPLEKTGIQGFELVSLADFRG